MDPYRCFNEIARLDECDAAWVIREIHLRVGKQPALPPSEYRPTEFAKRLQEACLKMELADLLNLSDLLKATSSRNFLKPHLANPNTSPSPNVETGSHSSDWSQCAAHAGTIRLLQSGFLRPTERVLVTIGLLDRESPNRGDFQTKDVKAKLRELRVEVSNAAALIASMGRKDEEAMLEVDPAEATSGKEMTFRLTLSSKAKLDALFEALNQSDNHHNHSQNNEPKPS